MGGGESIPDDEEEEEDENDDDDEAWESEIEIGGGGVSLTSSLLGSILFLLPFSNFNSLTLL